ncbi:hypothetical protein DITRI_Ditri15bG0116000 [Diplodiscus trichospermus]
MERSDCRFNSLPNDVALKIASFLEVRDLSSLGCCSRVWRELCRSDCLWEPLFKERWPLSYEDVLEAKGPHLEGWRACYIEQHEDMADDAAYVVDVVERRSLLESIVFNDFMGAVGRLESLQFGFKDVQMIFFRPKLNVLLNLVGLQYCLSFLQVPASDVVGALRSSKISDRQFYVKWLNFVEIFNDFPMPDESHSRSRRISLEDLATSKDKKVLGIFDLRSMHGVHKIRISYVSL